MSYAKLTREQIAQRISNDIPEGAYVNLGIGMPTLVANHLPKDREIWSPTTCRRTARFFCTARTGSWEWVRRPQRGGRTRT